MGLASGYPEAIYQLSRLLSGPLLFQAHSSLPPHTCCGCFDGRHGGIGDLPGVAGEGDPIPFGRCLPARIKVGGGVERQGVTEEDREQWREVRWSGQWRSMEINSGTWGWGAEWVQMGGLDRLTETKEKKTQGRIITELRPGGWIWWPPVDGIDRWSWRVCITSEKPHQ